MTYKDELTQGTSQSHTQVRSCDPLEFGILAKNHSILFCVVGVSQGKCSDLGVPAPYERNIAPMRVYHRRGRLIGESQERVARAICIASE